MPARDLTDDVRSGRLAPVELFESQRTTLHDMLSSLREERTVSLDGDDEYATTHLIESFATLLIAKEQESGNPSRPLIEAPSSLHELTEFAQTTGKLAEQQALVVLDLNAILAGDDPSGAAIDALKAPLAQLFLEPQLWLIILSATPTEAILAKHYQYLFRRREAAVNDRYGAAVRVRETGKPKRELFFTVSSDEGRQVMDTVRQADADFTNLLQACLDGLVSAARDNTFENRENHTVLAAQVLLVFQAALPFKPGYLHMLTIHVTGNRFRVSRSYQLTAEEGAD